MDDLFDTWCDTEEEEDGRKTLWRATECPDGREAVLDEIAVRTRSHYVSDVEIASFLEALGYAEAADVMRTQYPVKATGRSADLGEILNTEIIEEWCGHTVPIRKLRDKDHREQAMRGEDVIGVKIDDEDRLCLLKAEAKSARSLGEAKVMEARAALESNSGRPTAHSLVFIGRRLLESNVEEKRSLGARILQESVRSAVPKTRVTHCMFAFTGNKAGEMLDNDFTDADPGRDQYIIQLRIKDHGEFVESVYEKVLNLAID